jgi:hypothetical protein
MVINGEKNSIKKKHTQKQDETYIRKLRVVYVRGGFSVIAFS